MLIPSPCNLASGGFDSGWVFMPQGATNGPEWKLTITNETRRTLSVLPFQNCLIDLSSSPLVLLQTAFSAATLQSRCEDLVCFDRLFYD